MQLLKVYLNSLSVFPFSTRRAEWFVVAKVFELFAVSTAIIILTSPPFVFFSNPVVMSTKRRNGMRVCECARALHHE